MKRALPWLTLIPVVAILLLIFGFSAQDAEQSSELSGRITEQLLNLFHPAWSELSEAERAEALQLWHVRLRKAAHFSEFAALGFFVSLHFQSMNRAGWRFRIRPLWLCAWAVVSLAAMLDESSQRLHSGRAAQITDVVLDSAGALCGVALFALAALVFRLWRSRYFKRKGMNF